MRIKFNITNLSVEIPDDMEPEYLAWLWRSAKIPAGTPANKLSEKHKKELVKLAFYEGIYDVDDLTNVPNKKITIIP